MRNEIQELSSERLNLIQAWKSAYQLGLKKIKSVLLLSMLGKWTQVKLDPNLPEKFVSPKIIQQL